MAAPNVTLAVQPGEGGSILVLELAPLSSSHSGAAQLSLRFELTNHEPGSIHLNQVTLEFEAPPAVPPVTIAADLTLASGDFGEWHFATADNVILPWPTPPALTAKLAFDGYSTPVSVTAPLAGHTSPVAGGAYAFPFKAGTLSEGEYFSGRSAAHGPAGGGIQLFAYDIGVVAFDDEAGQWSGLHPGTDGSENEHYRIWGKPVYAMANGVVVTFADQYPNNPNPPADLSPPNPVEGNHFYLQHGTELVLYAHLQPGSLPSSLKQAGATVAEGDYLGLVGNTGNSSAPHIHVHAIKGTQPWQGPLRPLPFRGAGTIGWVVASEPPAAPPWVDLAARGLPAEAALVWPGTLPANLSIHFHHFVAIDPLALILRDDVYVKLTLPDPPPIETLRPRVLETLRAMTPTQRRRALKRIRALEGWLEDLSREIEALEKQGQKPTE